MIDRADDRLIRLPEVKARVALSTATIYRKMDDGSFPRAVQIGANSVAWYERDIAAWLNAPMEWKVAA